MIALVYDGDLHLDTRRDDTAPLEGDSLLSLRLAGICSTDLEIVRGYMGFAGVLGHEFVATVEESADRKLHGKRVVGEINCVCGRCELCVRGLSTHCRDRTVLGITGRDGCFAERFRLPSRNLHVLPETVSDEAAVFVEPLAAAIQVVRQLGRELGEQAWVTVLGSGRLGLLVAQVLRNAKAKVRVVGRNQQTLGLCDRWNIPSRLLSETKPRQDQDVVVDCTGSPEGLSTAMAMCRPRGTIVLKSTTADPGTANLAPIVINEITLLGSRCGPFKPAIDALARREVDVESLLQRRMKLSDGVEAMRVAGRPGMLKVLLTP